MTMTRYGYSLPPATLAHRPRGRAVARIGALLLAIAACTASTTVSAHGDVTPQAVDTTGLAALGPEWRAENPFRANERAVKIGMSAYNQNCARCHGIEAISGGIAPDLRKLDNECATLKDNARKAACVKEIDEFYLTAVRQGRSRNGAVYMPPFEGVMNQEAIWAIKAYLETRRETPVLTGSAR